MPLTHPLDALLRERLRALNPNQKEIAKRLGRSQGWLNKYLNGTGKATIDDVIRLVASVMLDVDTPRLTAEQRKLLREFDSLPPAGRKRVKDFVEFWSAHHRGQRSKSTARSGQKNHGTAGRSPGTR
jgi:transcriptional regulator with XRE-family HTH domain